ncbi:hypothetical protein A3K73_06780 [Candidatus Pacearchaeota archaeon RBG_13_36_9]|nr:MAG: hypothetical protein A3K73_06780 [Candidatus Pacearchaeota archaeon RBG_13_36_9]
MKTLVVYYSRSGNNKKIADELASSFPKADLERIVPEKDYHGMMGWLKAGYSAPKFKRVKINASRNPLDYNLVIFGGPLWAWGNLNNPLLSYLSNYKFKKTAFFSVSGSGNISQAMKQLQELGINPIATLALSDRELRENAYKSKITDFCSSLKKIK